MANPIEQTTCDHAPPRITIVTPSFNQATFLERTIRSVLEQGYPNLQYGVVDGGSTDGSADIIERYRDRLDFAVIEPDEGQSDAINKGLRRADGEVVGYLNSDDTLLPGGLRFVGDHFREHPGSPWLIGQCLEIDAHDRPMRTLAPLGTFTLEGALLRRDGFNVPQPATFWRRGLTDRLGLFDATLHYCMDFEMWCRFLADGVAPTLADQPLATYRLHGASKTCSDPAGFHRTLIQIEKRYARRLASPARRRLRRLIGFQTRTCALAECAGRPWRHVLTRPWWLASQQVRAALRAARASSTRRYRTARL